MLHGPLIHSYKSKNEHMYLKLPVAPKNVMLPLSHKGRDSLMKGLHQWIVLIPVDFNKPESVLELKI